MIKIATPVSDLFKNKENAEEIIKYSDCLECRDKNIKYKHIKEELFHCELQPIHKLSKLEINYLKKIKILKLNLKLISFHLASCCQSPKLEHGIFISGGRKYSRKEMMSNAKNNFSKIRDIFNGNIEIAVENNNYYPTGAYKFVTDPDFISEIVYHNRIRFLFDISHAKITSVHRKYKYEDYEKSLPLDQIIQIHISKIGFNKKGCYDAHELPGLEEIEDVKGLCSSRKDKMIYLTLEYYEDIKNLIRTIKKLKKVIDE